MGRLDGLDALRGLAACAIVILHACYIHSIGIPGDIFIRHLAKGVPLFFVLSAFTLTYRYSSGFEERKSLVRYGIRRLARIAPLFYLMLLIWLTYFRWLGSPPPGTTAVMLNVTFLFSLSPSTQTSIVPAGWSIGIEMLFYMAFPLLIRARSMVACAVIVATTFAAYAWFSMPGSDPRAYYFVTHPITNAPYFAMGILAARIFQASDTIKPSTAGALMGFSLLCISLAIALSPTVPPGQGEFVAPTLTTTFFWGAGFSLLVLSQAIQPARYLVSSWAVFLGTISYSVYLVHPLLIYASPHATWLSSAQIAWPTKALIVSSVALLASIGIGALLHRFIELPGQALGRRLTSGAALSHIQATR